MDPYHEYISDIVEGIKKDFPSATPEFVLAVLEKEASPKVFWLKENGNSKESANESRTSEKKTGKPTPKMLNIIKERQSGEKGNKESKSYARNLGDLNTLDFDEASDAIERIKEMEGWK